MQRALFSHVWDSSDSVDIHEGRPRTRTGVEATWLSQNFMFHRVQFPV